MDIKTRFSSIVAITFIAIFLVSCAAPTDQSESADAPEEMEFSEDEAGSEEEGIEFTEDEVGEDGEEMEFSEDEAIDEAEEEGFEFEEEEGTTIGTDTLPPEGQWILHNGVGEMTCPNLELDIEEGEDVTATLEWIDTQGYIFVLQSQEGAIFFTPYGFTNPDIANWLGVLDVGGLELKYFVDFYDVDGGFLDGHISSTITNEYGECQVIRFISGEYLGSSD